MNSFTWRKCYKTGTGTQVEGEERVDIPGRDLTGSVTNLWQTHLVNQTKKQKLFITGISKDKHEYE